MNRWMTLMKWIAVVDMAYLCFLCTEDAICRVKDWMKKKKGKKPGDVELEFYDFQEETEEHHASANASVRDSMFPHLLSFPSYPT